MDVVRSIIKDIIETFAPKGFDVQDCGTAKTAEYHPSGAIILGSWPCVFPQLLLSLFSSFHSAEFGSVCLGASARLPRCHTGTKGKPQGRSLKYFIFEIFAEILGRNWEKLGKNI